MQFGTIMVNIFTEIPGLPKVVTNIFFIACHPPAADKGVESPVKMLLSDGNWWVRRNPARPQCLEIGRDTRIPPPWHQEGQAKLNVIIKVHVFLNRFMRVDLEVTSAYQRNMDLTCVKGSFK